MAGRKKERAFKPAALNADWFLREAFRVLHEVIVLLDGRGLIHFAFGAVKEMLGHQPGELTGQPLAVLFADREASEAYTDGTLPGEGFATHERLRAKNGAFFMAEVSGSALPETAMPPCRTILSIRSMSSELAVQDALAARNEQLATLSRISNLVAEGSEFQATMEKLLLITMQTLNLPAACIHVLDRRQGVGRVVAHRGVPREIIAQAAQLPYDPAWLHTFLMEGRSLRLAQWPALTDAMRALLDKHKLADAAITLLISKGQIYGSLIYLPLAPLSTEAGALLDAIAGQMALAIDKHQLLQDLRESQRKYSSFIEGANDGIMISQNGVFKFVNKKLADMLEYTVSDMIGLDITRTMAAEDVPILLDHYRKRVSGQVPKEIYQGRLASRTGKLVPVEFNAVTVEFDGQPASLSFVRDLSERLRLQNELRAEKEIAELYNDVLTHDVNNLLHTIIGNLDLMADVHAGELAPALDQQRQKAMANARRCAQLIDRVRDLMMIRHLNPASFVPVSLRQMLEEALDVVREQFRGTAFAAHVQAQANQYILGHQLAGQIFINLMSNAIRHNANKDKWVNVAVQDVPGDQRWAIAVEDNGNGIPDGQKDKVYDRLRRLSAKGGHGLGGSIVKALVSVLGGSIRVEDRVPGDHTQGTRFVVLLPKA